MSRRAAVHVPSADATDVEHAVAVEFALLHLGLRFRRPAATMACGAEATAAVEQRISGSHRGASTLEQVVDVAS